MGMAVSYSREQPWPTVARCSAGHSARAGNRRLPEGSAMTTQPAPGRKSDTTVRRERDAEPQLPHERDESSQKDETPRPRIEQAQRDVSRGLVDTDRGPAMDKAYKKQQ